MIFALTFLTPTPSYMVFALTNFVIFEDTAFILTYVMPY